MKKLKALPLVLFSLLIPGMAIYCIFILKMPGSYLPIGLVTLALMLLSSFHLGKPLAAPTALSNIRKSYLSREMFFTGLFFLSMLIQMLFFQKTTTVALIIALCGVWATIAILSVYLQVPRGGGWPFSLDFFVEFYFIGVCFLYLFYGLTVALMQWIKGLKDLYLGIAYYRRTRKKVFLVVSGLAILTIALAQYPGSLLLGFINSLIVRFCFFARLEVPNLQQEAEEFRASYLPQEYQKYFKREC